MIDEVTGRIYADIGGDLRRVQVICSHRKRDEQELEHALREGGTASAETLGAAGDVTASPSPSRASEKSRGVSPKQAPPKVASVKARVRDEQTLANLPSNGERTGSSPVGVIRPVSSISAPLLGLEGTMPP